MVGALIWYVRPLRIEGESAAVFTDDGTTHDTDPTLVRTTAADRRRGGRGFHRVRNDLIGIWYVRPLRIEGKSAAVSTEDERFTSAPTHGLV